MDMRELSYGVEIETVSRTREAVARAIQGVVGGEVRYIGTPTCYDPWQVTNSQSRVALSGGSSRVSPFQRKMWR